MSMMYSRGSGRSSGSDQGMQAAACAFSTPMPAGTTKSCEAAKRCVRGDCGRETVAVRTAAIGSVTVGTASASGAATARSPSVDADVRWAGTGTSSFRRAPPSRLRPQLLPSTRVSTASPACRTVRREELVPMTSMPLSCRTYLIPSAVSSSTLEQAGALRLGAILLSDSTKPRLVRKLRNGDDTFGTFDGSVNGAVPQAI